MGDGIAQGRRQRLRIAEESGEPPLCLRNDRFVAEFAERPDQTAAQQSIVVVARATAIPAEPVEHGTQLGADIALQRRALGPIARQTIERGEYRDDLIPDRAAVIDADILDQTEIG